MEKWKEIEGYEGIYEVSTEGRVRSLARKCLGRPGFYAERKSVFLKPGVSKKGYYRVLLSNGMRKNISVHRLVALAFVEGRTESKNQVNHKNGDKADNTVSNLEWCTVSHNNRHARRMGLNICKSGEENHSYGLNNVKALRLQHTETKEIKSVTDVAKEYNFTSRYVTQMVKGERNNKTKYILL